LRAGDEWYAAAVNFGREAVPTSLIHLTDEGRAGRQIDVANEQPVMVVGIPIVDTNATYFEVFSLNELERTLSTLRWSLVIAASITTVIGGMFGAYLSRRVLRPLRTFAAGAEGIARGQLETRVSAPGDKDLAPLAGAFNNMASALQRRIEREARFASDVSHELRTPLTALSTAVEVLDRRADGDMRVPVDVVRGQVEHFEQLLLDLLEISRYDAGAVELAAEVVDVEAFFTSLVGELTDARVPLVVETSAPARFRLDKRRVERALANLLENANRYAGGATCVRLSGEPGRLCITVEDEGPGVVPEEQTAVFERFHRSAVASRDGGRGTGLGLALVAEHAALHGGRAYVQARPGGGAAFVVELSEDAES
jgi:signal transduction histidine kinase